MRLRTISLILVLLVGALPALPAEHAHESVVDARHEVLVHRHADSHLPGPRSHGQNHGDRVLDHDDGPIISLSLFFIAQPGYSSAPPARQVVARLAPPPMVVVDGPSAFVERLIHGPPKAPAGLRAPPPPSRL